MSLYSPDPLKFSQTDHQMAEHERRKEWPLLHGDGVTSNSNLNRSGNDGKTFPKETRTDRR